ncbi:hypothetical protein COW36_05740 [bacterium (Candidatus Blackallbacteria) CG17_big_fil_post_rev_8_21_14_2_50_48_46]|uniref:Uncharacterized protein n=1 Tax=bacterium (Candidatus Blackallbacteria) CG17_big_fil_post_rev_8_21_14_2_50_48_46 TaxID=2014261 RepID=A0A2M7G858_9BACT|nr:MAG: hypothetical protein COW64_21335 [bacterium (Candidatus Blackallbacteria) CG18_big_fil_WC_8_21_14_2_50_49_26]PIW18269.1 MAG: hypothetical protein COW36_05740 [bacterium (Candidatus Blackallbacteria) CG17_big_fil_post_rev_8_21_14_2_50_48_46]PIW49493.1 MAG: hypothetical protein COW20_05555 [bacterium (Candidatus Blackallbacteria) CG13_big_fil_rev_8_21_14_2_50_49_14]
MKKPWLGLLIVIFCFFPTRVDSVGLRKLYSTYYPPDKMARISAEGFKMTGSQLVWLPKKQKPTLTFIYHKAVPFYEQDITLHFSSTVTHHSESRVVKKNFHCQKDQKEEAFLHPKFGAYVLCSHDLYAKAFPTARNQTPIKYKTASVFPREGNRLPHITFQLHGFEQDIQTLMHSIETLDERP